MSFNSYDLQIMCVVLYLRSLFSNDNLTIDESVLSRVQVYHNVCFKFVSERGRCSTVGLLDRLANARWMHVRRKL